MGEGERLTTTVTHLEPGGGQPLISCIMPTCNRRSFVPRAIRQFLAQDYVRKELLILDDGSDPIAELVRREPVAAGRAHARSVAETPPRRKGALPREIGV